MKANQVKPILRILSILANKSNRHLAKKPVYGLLICLGILILTNCAREDIESPICNGIPYDPGGFECVDGNLEARGDWREPSPNSSSSWGGRQPSSSSSLASSSSVVSSSSGFLSSSSVLASSSSSSVVAGCTAADNTSTQYCSNGTMKTYGSVTYGGQTYKTVVIGTQTWMAENLNYNAEGSKYYGNDSAANFKYGRLYDWATAMGFDAACNSNSVGSDDCDETIETKHRGICPSGWHLPSDSDWSTLFNYVGGSSVAGKHLKATSGWNSGGNGLDTYGFAALPGGYGYSDGSFSDVGNLGYWWSSSEYGGSYAYYRYMNYYLENASWSYYSKSDLFSVRCLQD